MVKKVFPAYLAKNDNSVIQNIENIVNEFNDFFVKIGVNLSEEINLPTDDDTPFDLALNSN